MTFRRLSRDHALTEIYSYIVEAITFEPEWHARHFGLSDAQAAENAEATVFLEALLFRRYEAKLRYELDFWSRFADDRRHPGRLRGVPDRRDRHPLPRSSYLVRHGRRLLLGRLSARLDSLGPAPPPPRRRVGEDWWRNPATGEFLTRPLPRGHEALERGDRGPDRLRSARHGAAARASSALGRLAPAPARPIRLVA